MRYTAILSVALVLLLAGCTSTRLVQPDEKPTSLQELNRMLRGQKARIELADGEVIGQARAVTVGPTTTTYRTWHTRAERTVATESIERISIPKMRMRDFSPLLGLTGGAMAGPVVVLLWTGPSAFTCEGHGCFGVAIASGLAAIGGAVAGLITGFALRGPATMEIVYEAPMVGIEK